MKSISLVIAALLFAAVGFSQTKNFIDQPYLETTANGDTMVVPDKIFLSILITESDTKDKTSVEELENLMATELKKLGIKLDKQLTLSDLSSNFKKYFLKRQDILKAKSYQLLVYDAQTAGKVIATMENIGISNVDLEKTEYSKMEELLLALRTQAIVKAKAQADALVRPLQQKATKAIYVSDNNAQQRMYDRAEGIQMAFRAKSTDNYEPIEIDFEKIKVECTIQVKFAIE